LHDYHRRRKERSDFSATIKKALARIEQQRVESLVAGKGHPVGKIFDLKNNFGYKDQISLEDTTERPEETDEERSAMIDEIAEKVRAEMLKNASQK
jgi:hypothetical protein